MSPCVRFGHPLRGGDASSRQARARRSIGWLLPIAGGGPRQPLRLELIPSAADHRPGEAASVTVRVRDRRRARRRAEVVV